MTSDRICTNSMRMPRHRRSTLHAHVVDHLEDRAVALRSRGLRRATMSPVFCSVANRPSSAPVRRDVPAISGVAARMLLDDVQLPVGLGERGAARA